MTGSNIASTPPIGARQHLLLRAVRIPRPRLAASARWRSALTSPRSVLVRLAPLAVAGSLGLTVTGCGPDTLGVVTTVVQVQPTAFATIPPVASTLPGTTTTLPVGAVGSEQTYVVQAGDSPSRIAARYNISVTALLAYNGWVSAQQFPFPGTTILIPPEASAVDGGQTGTGTGTGTTGTNPALSGCGTRPAGTYKVQAGDSLYRITDKFCVSMNALLSANNWSSPSSVTIIPGQSINIPPAGN